MTHGLQQIHLASVLLKKSPRVDNVTVQKPDELKKASLSV